MKRPGENLLAPWLLMAPALLLVLVCFGIPALFMARMSLNGHAPQSFYVPGLTLGNFQRIGQNPIILAALWNTLRLALVASVLAIALSYIFALIVWLKPRRWRLILVGVALLPMLISEISIIFGWWMFFPRNGLLSYALVASGLMEDKASLLYTEGAALVGLVYVTLPYCFFILLSVFDGLDRRTLEAAADLNASPFVTFIEVILPQTRGGILSAFAQAFIWTIGTYATPLALGPDTLWTIGYLVQDQMLGKHHWPMAAALSIAMMSVVAVVVLLTRLLQPKRTSFHV